MFEGLENKKYTKIELLQMKPLVLAFVGDCVYELYVRNFLITERYRDVNDLHRKSVFFVKAKAQAHILHELEEELTEEPIIWDNYNPASVLLSENWALTLINKNYPLDKNYSPSTAIVVEGSSVSADIRVAEAYRLMYNAALTEDVILTPYSGYCGYQRQKTIYDNKVQAFILQGLSQDEAKLNAEKRVEPAGCSENGAGLAVDVISASAGFSSTEEYKWLIANAHNYGFVLRYPEDKTEITGMIYQPWHWRYVGIEVATEMKENNLCLEEFLGAV